MDVLHRFSFVDLPVRGQWVRIEQVLGAAVRNKTYPSNVQVLLGEMFAAVAMFADNLKFEGAVALQSQGEGALIRSLAECRNQQFLRGIAHVDPAQPTPDGTDLRAWLGRGRLALTLIPEPGTKGRDAPYQGLVELAAAELAENLEHYFKVSEQLRTRIFFASNASVTTGFLLQRLPDSDLASEVSLDAAEQAWHTIETLAQTVTTAELAALPPDQLLHRLFNEFTLRIHPARVLRYRCTCSRIKSDQTLKVFHPDELQEILQEDGEIKVDCEFCGAQYCYDAIDVAALQHDPVAPAPDDQH